jgi:hypothetical protein
MAGAVERGVRRKKRHHSLYIPLWSDRPIHHLRERFFAPHAIQKDDRNSRDMGHQSTGSGVRA